MKILFLSPRVPHAGIAGGYLLVYQRMRRLLERGHRVGLMAFESGGKEGVDPVWRDALMDFECLHAPHKRTGAARVWTFATSTTPPYFHDYRSPEMMRRVGDVVEERGYDVVIAEFSAMGQYLVRNPYLPAVRKLISCHSSVASLYEDRAHTLGFRARGLRSRASVGRLRRFEMKMFREVDRILVFTAHELYRLQAIDPQLRVHVVHPGVDTGHFKPAANPVTEPRLVFTGNYEMFENIDAVEWFLGAVWPLIRKGHPEASFTMIGPGAERLLNRLADRDPRVFATGRVEDVRPHLQSAMIFVCPIRIGGGFHFKVLEAMSAGVPVIATPEAAEGIPLQTGENCFIADRPEMFARCVDLLIGDGEMRELFVQRARDLVREKFEWDRCMDVLEGQLSDVRKR
ncbi:MAG TPA: glycosyltransferase [Kiritimatiellia bacterium]|nr:glycosyltransferase [Kiritimatiellia bacterium]